jgi:transposase-like protein
MPRVTCPDCDQDIAVHQLETKTTTQRDGFETRYRCPFCHAEVENVAERFA